MRVDCDSTSAMDTLLGSVVDSFEKLDVVVFLFHARGTAQAAATIGARLGLSPGAVAEALAALSHAGIVRTINSDGAGWWFEPASVWATTVEVVVELYEHDRGDLLRLMRRVGIERTRVAGWVSPSPGRRVPRKPTPSS